MKAQMELNKQSIILLIFGVFLAGSGFCARISTKIYRDVDVDSTPMCFRRFNATHQTGCSSDRGGNVGAVYVALNTSSINDLLIVDTHLKFIIITNMDLFSKHAKQLIVSPKVRGIVILNINDSSDYVPASFSPDLQCPNEAYGDGVSCNNDPWNSYGTGLLFEDYPFPVVSLQDDTVADFIFKECFEKHNQFVLSDWSTDSRLCGMHIKDVMDGAKDTPTCFRRSNLQINLSPQRYCDPLGNKNLFSLLRPMQRNQANPVIVIAARLDSFSMFDHFAPGFESAVLSYVTLFAVAEAIGNVKAELNGTNKNILFALFHGEAFDYIGSSRMVYDIEGGVMNFTLDDIEMFIEIGQVGLHDQRTVYIHQHGPQVNTYVEKLIAIGNKTQLNVTEGQLGVVPPASLQSFIKVHQNISGIVVSTHNKYFSNRYYNSMYDKPQFAGLEYPSSFNDSDKYEYVGELATHLQKLSTAIAQSVFSFVTDSAEAPSKCASNSTTIAHMLYCFAINSSCELLNSSYTNSCASGLKSEDNVRQRYVGVGRGRAQDYCLKYVLAHFLGDVVEGNNWTQKDCENLSSSLQDGYFYVFVRGDVANASDPSMTRTGRCIRTMANASDAVSPAFEIDDYDWSSGKYPSWSESVWDVDAMRVKIFLMPSHNQEVKTFVIGLFMLVFSFGAVYFIERKSSVLFPVAPTA